MIKGLRSLCALAIAVLKATCSVPGAVEPLARPAPLVLAPCHLGHLPEEIQCGTMDVYEDRDASRGRLITIHVSVLPALVRGASPDPFVVLAGGPGQGARSYAALVPRFFQRIRRTRDVVLVDLRGTGDSAPLKCPIPAGALAFLSSEPPAESARRCLAGLDRDPRFYTHRNTLADLRDVLHALGYASVNLWGGSWGTRAALVFAATYPDLVRTVVLDGAVAAATDFPWSYPHDAQRALDRLLDGCGRDPACRRTFPDSRQEIARWLAGLEQPMAVTLRHPRSAQAVAIRLDRDSAAEVLRAALYSPLDASRVLIAVRRAANGDHGPLAAMAEQAASWSLDTMALGQTMSILCSEDVGRHSRPAGVEATLFKTGAIDNWIERCAVWPKGPPLAIDANAKLATPALILSGDLDPVTPPARGTAMQQHFPNSLHVVAPGAGHNVSFSGCVPRLIAEFVQHGRWQALDASCARAIARPPFVTSLAGAQP